jgi:hypothetical protein
MSIATSNEGRSDMSAPTDYRRELAHRASSGIDVSLFWSKPTNQVTIEVVDTRFGEGFEFEVDGSAALDAFHHPYAYAAAHGFGSPTTALAA